MSGIDAGKMRFCIDAMLGRLKTAEPKSFLIDFSACLYAVVLDGSAAAEMAAEAADPRPCLERIYQEYPELPKREYRTGEGICAVEEECRRYVGEILKMVGAESAFRKKEAAKVFHAVLDRMIQERIIKDFITPEDLCSMMAGLTKPAAGEIVIDPACGSGRFLAAAYEQCPDCRLFGIDNADEFRELAFFQMFFHGGTAVVCRQDFLTLNEGELPKADLILSNPPYMDKTELTVRFVDKILAWLKDGGRCAVLVPQGFLTNSVNNAVKAGRRTILETCTLEAVVMLPRKIYRPYTQSHSSMLMIRKSGQRKRDYPVFISILPENESADAARADEIYREGMRQIALQWENYLAGNKLDEEVARIVPADRIRENGYIFAAENYWKEAYVPVENKLEDRIRKLHENQRRLDGYLEELMGMEAF